MGTTPLPGLFQLIKYSLNCSRHINWFSRSHSDYTADDEDAEKSTTGFMVLPGRGSVNINRVEMNEDYVEDMFT